MTPARRASAEFAGTALLVAAVVGSGIAAERFSPGQVGLVGASITAAYWFTSSTSFANPSVTNARTLTDTFTGTRPGSAPGFVLAQLLGGTLGYALVRVLHPVSPGARRVPTATGPDQGARA